MESFGRSGSRSTKPGSQSGSERQTWNYLFEERKQRIVWNKFLTAEIRAGRKDRQSGRHQRRLAKPQQSENGVALSADGEPLLLRSAGADRERHSVETRNSNRCLQRLEFACVIFLKTFQPAGNDNFHSYNSTAESRRQRQNPGFLPAQITSRH